MQENYFARLSFQTACNRVYGEGGEEYGGKY
jgi:hypothetical protein